MWPHLAPPLTRVIADDGSILRELTLDPSRNYQPTTLLGGSTIS
jgi:hypothetical protein